MVVACVLAPYTFRTGCTIFFIIFRPPAGGMATIGEWRSSSCSSPFRRSNPARRRRFHCCCCWFWVDDLDDHGKRRHTHLPRGQSGTIDGRSAVCFAFETVAARAGRICASRDRPPRERCVKKLSLFRREENAKHCRSATVVKNWSKSTWPRCQSTTGEIESKECLGQGSAAERDVYAYTSLLTHM